MDNQSIAYIVGTLMASIGAYLLGRVTKDVPSNLEVKISDVDMNTQAAFSVLINKVIEINNKLDQTFIFKKKEEPKKKK